ncbi:diguanylate cyclase [Methylomarinum sp. Ch1-1]|uniref:diguanylate cyclase n=1 Tax=Methylomarinum roseum TaxID=3067653 RepID=A0AAU7NR72_9GAMM|nr:diguanylate cyclase [Methylomarinum sp. Ch1-1]MDP4520576.1 diguanylate cyclase [Methylomarinum sp. Ch1-1]
MPKTSFRRNSGALDTHLAEAERVAGKIRQLVSDEQIDGVSRVTASFGVAQLNKAERLMDFLKRADQALYEAKVSGRDAVHVAASGRDKSTG